MIKIIAFVLLVGFTSCFLNSNKNSNVDSTKIQSVEFSKPKRQVTYKMTTCQKSYNVSIVDRVDSDYDSLFVFNQNELVLESLIEIHDTGQFIEEVNEGGCALFIETSGNFLLRHKIQFGDKVIFTPHR